MLNKIHTGILLILAAGAPVLVVVPEQFWFEKRIALAGAGVVILALWAAQAWTKGKAGVEGKAGEDLGWGLIAAALVVGAAVPAGRIANLLAPELWVALSAILAYFAIKSTTTSSRMVKLGFFGVLGGLLAAGIIIGIEEGRYGESGELGNRERRRWRFCSARLFGESSGNSGGRGSGFYR